MKYEFILVILFFISLAIADTPDIFNNYELEPEQLPTVQASSLSRAKFFRDYVQSSQPVVIRGALKNWPSKPSDWTNEFVRNLIGHKNVRVEVAKDDNVFHFYQSEMKSEDMTVSQFLDLFSNPAGPKRYYIAQQDIDTKVPEIKKHISRFGFDAMLEYEKSNFWMGSGGQLTPLHFDDNENLLVMLAGTKHFTVYPPHQARYLYPRAPSMDVPGQRTYTTKLNITQPDLKRFPLFEKATPFEATVEAGDVLYLPSLWWHQVRSEGRNIAANFWYFCHSDPLPAVTIQLVDAIIELQKDIMPQGDNNEPLVANIEDKERPRDEL